MLPTHADTNTKKEEIEQMKKLIKPSTLSMNLCNDISGKCSTFPVY